MEHRSATKPPQASASENMRPFGWLRSRQRAVSVTRRYCTVLALGSALSGGMAAFAAADECPGNPHALGTSRTITLDSTQQARVASLQPETLPLQNGEVVLTFDDGPIPPSTDKVLGALAFECVKATFFALGSNAKDSPELIRRIHSAGHTIGTHTQNHLRLRRLPFAKAKAEIDRGIASIQAALGNGLEPAPFFRAPYLEMTRRLDNYIASRGITLWDVDLDAHDSDDGKKISANQVIARSLREIRRAGKGILLLHDTEPETARALPNLLRELQARNYRIVHVVPAQPEPEQAAAAASNPQPSASQAETK
jgi:peptidoglycan/xylan/chitin deacetylase (PgdA/CDA1 family)